MSFKGVVLKEAHTEHAERGLRRPAAWRSTRSTAQRGRKPVPGNDVLRRRGSVRKPSPVHAPQPSGEGSGRATPEKRRPQTLPCNRVSPLGRARLSRRMSPITASACRPLSPCITAISSLSSASTADFERLCDERDAPEVDALLLSRCQAARMHRVRGASAEKQKSCDSPITMARSTACVRLFTPSFV